MPFLTSVMPTIFFVGFFLMFFAIFGITIYSIIKGVAAKKRDDAAPVLDVWARVTGKRTDYVRRRSTMNAVNYGYGYSEYFATFQVASGDRMELSVSGEEYGLLREEDEGTLRFQGKRFLGFTRSGESIEKSPEIR